MPMEFLHKKLQERRDAGTWRSLRRASGGVDFYSNDYLGMAGDPGMHVRAEVLLMLARLRHRNGSGGSRLLSGNLPFYEETETYLARFFGAESALVYHSGYDALLGTLSCLPGRTDTVLYDEFIHASARDGIRLSPAKNRAFRHNDLQDLETRLQKAEGNVFVVVESLYSMDGDKAPLDEMRRLQQRYGFIWVIDEAHAGGVYGEKGGGLASGLAADGNVVRIVTFGKAYGTEGACVLAGSVVRDYLVNFSRPFIYTTAPSPHFFANMRASLEAVARADRQRAALLRNIETFGAACGARFPCTDSPIQVYKPGDTAVLEKLTKTLSEAGLCVRPIYHPTVPAGQERLRIVLHAYNTEAEIGRLCDLLAGE